MTHDPAIKDHPALQGAKLVIRRSLSRLTPKHVMLVASIVEALQETDHEKAIPPDHVWQCDAPAVTKGGR
jgi:hypothetical protein